MAEKVYRGADDRDEPPATLDKPIHRKSRKQRRKRLRNYTRCPNCVNRISFRDDVHPDEAIYDHVWTECGIENTVPHLERSVSREEAREKRMANGANG
jgi:hypothetical protein